MTLKKFPWLSVLVAALLVLMILQTCLVIVREFHEQPVKVYYCDSSECEAS